MRRKPFQRLIVSVSVTGILILAACAKPNVAAVPSNIDGLQVLAARGNAVAANNLGGMYANGNGVPRDFN